ncbi:hypothetical protein DUNSADRAFT_900 [Dunaliella salina]|uniref:Encoded protein n=1 Tax=Dunaliella salina TaxID=3046 RepID=A0ABQ7H8N8_DUNSA|nr:hypothetical protein DUNSADRAFT_900 [Dunaliella salina]KAF5843225.1 hypothetical protein DUNSADRAFT_900 [Dunaliella salina]|eukprot:KAF5843224.1 hypothetical protein DUNSADRAFT_900 [Dunaliella salina]
MKAGKEHGNAARHAGREGREEAMSMFNLCMKGSTRQALTDCSRRKMKVKENLAMDELEVFQGKSIEHSNVRCTTRGLEYRTKPMEACPLRLIVLCYCALVAV